MRKYKTLKVLVCGMILYSGMGNSIYANETSLANPEPKEILYVNFNNQVKDQSGQHNNGNAVGNPAYVPGLGSDNQALHIQNPDANAEGGKNPKQYVDFGTTMKLNSDDYAIAFWWKDDRSKTITGDSGGSIIANKDYNSGANKGFALGSFTNDIRVNFNATNARKEHRVTKFEDGKWHHIAVNYDRDGDMTTYVDGVEAGKTAIVDQKNNTIDVEGNHFAIGADGKLQNGLSGGYYDDLHVFQGLLDQTKIQQLYNVYAEDVTSDELLEAQRLLKEQLDIGTKMMVDASYHASDIGVFRPIHEMISSHTNLTVAKLEEYTQSMKDAINLLNAKKTYRMHIAEGVEALVKNPTNAHANNVEKALQNAQQFNFDTAKLEDVEKADRDVQKAIQRFLQNDQRNMSFAILSDTHVGSGGDTNSKYLLDAMSDLKQREPLTDTILIAGDLTQNGTKAEYNNFTNIMENNWLSQGMNAVTTQGNHDVRWLCGTNSAASSDPNVSSSFCGVDDNFKTRYLPFKNKWLDTEKDSTTKDKVYYDSWINGYHFISLNTEIDLKDRAYLSDEQLHWFKNTLAKKAKDDQPIFVTLHQPLENTHARSTYWTVGDQDKKMKEILKDYPQVIFISGHIHNGIGVAGAVHQGFGTMLDAPSLAQNENGINQQQIGYIVNVYDSYTQVRVYDFKNDKYLDDYEMTIDDNIDETYNSEDDLPVEEISISAKADEGYPVSNMTDADETTVWQSKDLNSVLTIDLKGSKLIDGLRYLPTQNYKIDGINAGGRAHQMQGFIEKYRIEVSNDDQNSWKVVKEGTWQSNNYWKRVSFPSQKATHIRVTALGSPTYNTNTYLTAAELRVTGSTYNLQAYNNTIDEYRKLNFDKYTTSSYQTFKELLAQSIDLQYQELVTAEQLTLMLQDLSNAQHQMVLRASLNELMQAYVIIQKFDVLQAKDYTDVTWNDLKVKLDSMKKSLEVMEECGQEMLKQQMDEVQKALTALEKVKVPSLPEIPPVKPNIPVNKTPGNDSQQNQKPNIKGDLTTGLEDASIIKATGQKQDHTLTPSTMVNATGQKSRIPFSAIACGAGIVLMTGLLFLKKRESLKR